MPSQRKSYHWFCRVDGSYVECKTFCSQIAEWVDCDKIFGMFHTGQTGENPHCHFVMRLRTELQKQSFDKRFKVLLTDKNSREWSSKIWDGQINGAGSYMFHEDSDLVVISKGFVQDEIDKMRSYNQEVKAKVVAAKLKGPGAVIERAIEKLQDKMMTQVMSHQQRRNFAVSYFLWEVKRGNMHVQADYKLKLMAEEVLVNTINEDHFESYVREKLSQLYV